MPSRTSKYSSKLIPVGEKICIVALKPSGAEVRAKRPRSRAWWKNRRRALIAKKSMPSTATSAPRKKASQFCAVRPSENKVNSTSGLILRATAAMANQVLSYKRFLRATISTRGVYPSRCDFPTDFLLQQYVALRGSNHHPGGTKPTATFEI